MVDIEKLSDFSNKTNVAEATNSDSGINLIDAIKSVSGLLKEINNLKDQKAKPKNNQNIIDWSSTKEIKTPKNNIIKSPINSPLKPPIPQEPKTIIKEVIKEVPVVPKPIDKEQDINQKYDDLLKVLDIALSFYGNIPLEDFIKDLRKNRIEIIKKAKKFI